MKDLDTHELSQPLQMDGNGPLRSTTSRSINCLVSSASANSLNNGAYSRNSSNQFLNNLIKMHQTKIWEDAKCRTFYARDNVCSFIKWTKYFGVNQSVLFESDDLVLHGIRNLIKSSQIFPQTSYLTKTANPRQVVLCLLDVARIAYVKYGFTEAPGLVKFEQEIDREHSVTKRDQLHRNSELVKDRASLTCDRQRNVNSATEGEQSGRARISFEMPIDATDELVMRYCRHKEEEAARKRNEELAAAATGAEAGIEVEIEATKLGEEQLEMPSHAEEQSNSLNFRDEPSTVVSATSSEDKSSVIENSLKSRLNMDMAGILNSYNPETERHPNDASIEIVSLTTCDSKTTHNVKNLADTGRIDSLDSGEGPTESASTGHGSTRMLADSLSIAKRSNQHTPGTNQTSIPVPKKRANFTSSQTIHQTESSMTNSELSSSRSSLLSNQDNLANNYERQATSDLDGKVMRIAKSYYGKKATKDVMRLSEGKYRIADRIVFVRLLKGHRVMVRIGGGWDTLENFLFRHKSDPSQVIDPENLLPLETKMPFDKTPQATPTKSASKLPYYRLSSSVSTSNMSVNLSASNHSLISSTTRIPSNNHIRAIPDVISNSAHSSPTIDRSTRNQIPTLSDSNNSISRQPPTTPNNHIVRLMPHHNQVSTGLHDQQQQKNKIPQSVSAHNSPATFNLKRAFYYHKTTTPTTSNRYNHQRPLAASMGYTASASDIHLFDSFARFPGPKRDRGPNRKLILK